MSFPRRTNLSSLCVQQSGLRSRPARLAFRRDARKSVVLRAESNTQEARSSSSAVQKGAKVLAAAVLAASLGASTVDAARADISGLKKCSDSKAYKKRESKELKGLKKRLALYEEGSAPALAIQATMAKTEHRFKMYADTGVLCGKDGYPHLIADPGFALQYGHTGEILVPAFFFVYIAGYIGYAGRSYLQAIRGVKKPTEKEIIIDVPLAVGLMGQAAAWPIKTYAELRSGDLLEKKENITVSPR